ncbi:jg2088 [Pararge aegeria aegeria]|uniref:Jg2088 protein n=1 Tax=Pararge aegeria aegeria TaxID=348720 RepID=A0A8S4RXU1_9NEOP|nr:jg2088 [Pararge aegeria aegeria]
MQSKMVACSPVRGIHHHRHINPLLAHYRARVSSNNEKGLRPPRWHSADWWTSHTFGNIMENLQECIYVIRNKKILRRTRVTDKLKYHEVEVAMGGAYRSENRWTLGTLDAGMATSHW